ncbi:hypothetical protein [Nostoc sp.]
MTQPLEEKQAEILSTSLLSFNTERLALSVSLRGSKLRAASPRVAEV